MVSPLHGVRGRCHPLCATSSGWCAPNGYFVWRAEHVESRAEHVGHVWCVSLVRRCTMQRNRLQVTQLPDDCIAIVHFFRMLQRNRSILHQKLHFFVSPFVLSPFGPPQTPGGYRRDQPQDHIMFTSWHKWQDWQQLEKWLPREEPLPRWQWSSRRMNLAQGPSYVLTGGSHRNVRSSSSTILHQYLRCTSHSIGHQLIIIIIKGPTGQNIFDKVNNPAIISSHLFDQISISGPPNSDSRTSILTSLTWWTIVKWQEEATSTSKTIGRTFIRLGYI